MSVRRHGPDVDGNLAALPQTRCPEHTPIRQLPPTTSQTGEFICASSLAPATPIFEVLCPVCQTVGDVDLRKLGRHPGATIASLIPSLPCRRSQRVCRSRSDTVEDLAASNSSASAWRFICCRAVCRRFHVAGGSCRIGHRHPMALSNLII